MKTHYTIQKTTRTTIQTQGTPDTKAQEEKTETTVQATIEAESSAEALRLFNGVEAGPKPSVFDLIAQGVLRGGVVTVVPPDSGKDWKEYFGIQ
jgi:hypothetical protein